MKNILLLTDFSNNAQNAIDYALEFFRDGQHHFFLLNVQKVSNYTTADLMTTSPKLSVYDSIIKNPKAEINDRIDALRIAYANEDYSFKGICDYDNFVNAVSQTIHNKQIDLIVMGTNGATGASEVIFGSNTINVIRHINRPVLAIPENYKFTKPRTILFATHTDEIFNEESLSALRFAISKYNIEVHILLLDKSGDLEMSIAKKNKIDAFFKGYNHSFYSIENVPVDIAIDSFVQIKHADLTAKIINKEVFLKRFFAGSKTDEITYNTRVPLLIMHPKTNTIL